MDPVLTAAESGHYYAGVDVVGCAAACQLTQGSTFIDWNKRVAAVVTEIFLGVNGDRVNVTEDQLYGL